MIQGKWQKCCWFEGAFIWKTLKQISPQTFFTTIYNGIRGPSDIQNRQLWKMAGRKVPTSSTCSSQASCRPRGSGLWAWLAGWPPGRCSPSPSSFPHRTSGAVQTTSNFQVLIALLKVLQGFCKSSNFPASCLKCIKVQHFTMELKDYLAIN